MKIKEFRQERNFTQLSLAKKLGVSQSAVAKWENGDTFPRTNILQKMSELFNCTIDELVKGEKE